MSLVPAAGAGAVAQDLSPEPVRLSTEYIAVRQVVDQLINSLRPREWQLCADRTRARILCGGLSERGHNDGCILGDAEELCSA